jgi:uncharacterized protein DUF4381
MTAEDMTNTRKIRRRRRVELSLLISASAALCVTASLIAQGTNAGPNGPIPQLRPPRGEIPPTFWEQNAGWVWASALAAVAMIGAAVWYARRPRPEVTVSPEVAARQALEPLRAKLEDGVLLSQVSQILRRYIIRAFALDPGELTTTEFCAAIGRQPRINPELAAALSDFLRRCDERKFSPASAGPAIEAVPNALRFVELAEARLAALRQPARESVANYPKAAASS